MSERNITLLTLLHLSNMSHVVQLLVNVHIKLLKTLLKDFYVINETTDQDLQLVQLKNEYYSDNPSFQ